jgi:hypothetical protein
MLLRFVTLACIVTLVRLLQPENVPEPIDVTLAGNVTLVRPVQLLNASIDITGRYWLSALGR